MFPTIVTAEKSAEPVKADFTDFLKTAKQRFKLCSEAEEEIRKEAVEDLDFRAGIQWPAQIEADRQAAMRPCLTINRLPQFIKQVVNEQRQNRPSIQINPVGNGANKDTAEIFQGLTRHIEVNSNADVAYDGAFEAAVVHGFGYFRVLTDYEDEKSFHQEVFIKRIANPFTVYIDPMAQEHDYSDMRYCFITQKISRDEFKARFGKSELAGLADWKSIGDEGPDWFPDGDVTIAEYFYVETKDRTLCSFSDGSVAWENELPEVPKGGEPHKILNRRTVETKQIKWVLMDAIEKLEERDWPGKWIPIIPVLGDEIIVRGKRQLIGIVRFARDPQRMYNYMRSAVTEMIALAPKAPYVMAEGQAEGHEKQWEQSNVRNIPVLYYKPTDVKGHPVPPPQRNFGEPPIQAATVALQQSDNDLKATTGLYDASLGAPGPEQSGKAIIARQEEGNTANSHFIDNLKRSIEHCGRILLDLIPKIYDAPRIVRIINPDQTSKMVQINQPITKDDQQILENGMPKIFDMTAGRYDVTVTVGPSYQSRRQEAASSMIDLVKQYPPVMQAAGDLMVRMMDWPYADEIADRLKKLLPPALQEPEDGSEPLPPQAQSQIMQLTQQLQQAQQMLQMTTDMIKTKKLELESKERVAGMQAQAQIIAAEIRAKAANAGTDAERELEAAAKRLELLHEGISIDQEIQGQQFDQQHQLRQQAIDKQQADQDSARADQAQQFDQQQAQAEGARADTAQQFEQEQAKQAAKAAAKAKPTPKKAA